jgi:hypothetical protein
MDIADDGSLHASLVFRNLRAQFVTGLGFPPLENRRLVRYDPLIIRRRLVDTWNFPVSDTLGALFAG